MAKKLRGPDLNKWLVDTLSEMKKLGFKVAPITRANLQRRGGYKSRGTLLKDGRAALIDAARESQLHEAGLDKNEKKRRSTQDEQIQNLKKEIEALKNDRDNLTMKLAEIINGLQAKGYKVEEIMLPLRPNYKAKKK